MSAQHLSLRPPTRNRAASLLLAAALAIVTFLPGFHTAAAQAPVARVYVSYTPSAASLNKLLGYSVSPNGALATLPGMPYRANVGSIATNGAYLFGSNLAGQYVASFRVHSDGSLQWVNSTDVQSPDETGCVYPSDIILDHAGATLYRMQFTGGLCDHSHYQSFMVDKPTGKLLWLGKSADIFLFDEPLSVSGNNQFAYASECFNYQGGPLDNFSWYVRESSGLLNLESISAPAPATHDPSHFYCRAYTAADPTNHLAVTFTDTDFNNPFDSPAAQLGVYTVQPSGSLTTTSTWSNMPSTAIGTIAGLAMSPDGKLLAVNGTAGLQVFHFNGAGPVTAFTGPLTTANIDMAYWDHSQHLFAISKNAGKLYVFTVTSTTAAAAPGSPHAISSPAGLIVRPLN
ncbi:hypothetical protein [Occallatibacter riparius]|uniref:Lactonase family protein n=1 Tax=Occallatibacter riparius TaxID=1002689 RepID=A0A9J7BSA9_9BACT|nr:hypothetical protein [Occallatibacter riparius]UWZ85465.1 hypothetical protein MOP44_05865 [Occallatibacter riparius]